MHSEKDNFELKAEMQRLQNENTNLNTKSQHLEEDNIEKTTEVQRLQELEFQLHGLEFFERTKKLQQEMWLKNPKSGNSTGDGESDSATSTGEH